MMTADDHTSRRIAQAEISAGTTAIVRREDINGAPYEVTARGIQMIREWAASGASNSFIAAELGISRHTFIELRKRQPEIDEALDVGRAIDEREVANKLRSMAMEGQVAPVIFYLKARHGWRDNDPPAAQVNVQTNVAVTVNVDAMPRPARDALRKAAEAMRAVQQQPVIDVPPDPQGEGESDDDESR